MNIAVITTPNDQQRAAAKTLITRSHYHHITITNSKQVSKHHTIVIVGTELKIIIRVWTCFFLPAIMHLYGMFMAFLQMYLMQL